MKGGGEKRGDRSGGLVDEEEGDSRVKDGGEPVNHKEVCHLAADDQAKWREDPMKAQVGHRVLPLVKPFRRQLLHAGDEVQHEELELQQKVVPEWHFGVEFIAPRVDGAVEKKRFVC